MLSVENLDVNFEIQCSKGTYIRSIAHDFGQHLNSGGYLSKLRRTKIGEHVLSKALSIESFTHDLNS